MIRFALILSLLSSAAFAELELCNEAQQPISVVQGARHFHANGTESYTSWGWLNLAPGDCSVVYDNAYRRFWFYAVGETGAIWDGAEMGTEFRNFCIVDRQKQRGFAIADEDTDPWVHRDSRTCAHYGGRLQKMFLLSAGQQKFRFYFTAGPQPLPTQPGQPAPTSFDPNYDPKNLVSVPKTIVQLCNHTGETLDVARALTTAAGWMSEGWIQIPGGTPKCIDMNLQYYKGHVYFHARNRFQSWGQDSKLCVNTKQYFRILDPGRNACYGRGLRRAGFAELKVRPGRITLNFTNEQDNVNNASAEMNVYPNRYREERDFLPYEERQTRGEPMPEPRVQIPAEQQAPPIEPAPMSQDPYQPRLVPRQDGSPVAAPASTPDAPMSLMAPANIQSDEKIPQRAASAEEQP